VVLSVTVFVLALDLGKALPESYRKEELIVHQIDEHPNEIAHRAVAQELLQFLQRSGGQAVKGR
jgi:hypothetical protein